MKKLIAFSLFFFCINTFSIAQNILVREASEVTRLVEKHIELNRATLTISGWRIQLFATTDRSKLEAARGTFINRYPHIPVDWVHASPWYRLRAGAFMTKLEATQMLHTLKIFYPDAYLAKDKIRPDELMSLKN